DDPGRLDQDLSTVDPDSGRHWAVGDVVVPAVVVCEIVGPGPISGAGDAAPAEEDEAARIIGLQLAEINRFTQKAAGIKLICTAARSTAMDCPWTGVDNQLPPVGPLDVGVSSPGRLDLTVVDLGDVHGESEVVPGGLLVRDVGSPLDDGVVDRQLVD